jgi:high-affinity Fe2+/Pb2+ permease
MIEHVWNMDSIISQSSILGQLLQTLFGYNSSPALTEMIAYFGYIAVVAYLWRRENTITVKATAESKA